MRLGLTGATGVLGQRLREAAGRQGLTVTPLTSDVRDRDNVTALVDACDVVIHAAAIVPVDTVRADLATAIAVNVGGTANVAQTVASAGKRLVYVSTSHVYRSAEAPLPEDAPIAPVSDYGFTKWQGEEWVRHLLPDALIVRLFSYFDSRQAASYLVPALRRRTAAAPRGASLELRGAGSVRDMADATWLAETLVALLLGGATGTVNCGTGQGYSIAEVATRLSRAMQREDITWTPVDDTSNSLVADTHRLTLALPDNKPFELDAALARFVLDAQ